MKPNGTISLMIDGKMKSVENTHVNYKAIVDKLNKEDYENLLELVDMITAVKEKLQAQSEELFKLDSNVIIYKDYTLNDFMSQRIISMMNESMNLKPLANFIDKLFENPSYRAVNSLYEFLEFGGIPLSPNGNFLVYKKVRQDYKDIHSGKFDNSPGAVVKMPRYAVDENPDNTCSHGLHVCSFDYLKHFGSGSFDRIVICEVNPKDVVAIPKDYNNTKMRVCEYKVVGELESDIVDSLRDTYCVDSYCDYEDEFDDDFDLDKDDEIIDELNVSKEDIKEVITSEVTKLGENISKSSTVESKSSYMNTFLELFKKD
jgi:hypothetical protein